MKKDFNCPYCNHINKVDDLNSSFQCEKCNQPLGNFNRNSYRKSQKGQNNPLQDIKNNIGEWGIVLKAVVLFILGWIIYKSRVFLFLLLTKLITSVISIFDPQFENNMLFNHDYFLQNIELTDFISKYFFIFSIIGFVDKFFPEFFPGLFHYSERVREIIPSFPFSGLVRFIIIFAELFFKVVWLFSSSVIRFVTSLFSFIFVLVYKFSNPLFKFIMGVLDLLNVVLDRTSHKMNDKSKKMER